MLTFGLIPHWLKSFSVNFSIFAPFQLYIVYTISGFPLHGGTDFPPNKLEYWMYDTSCVYRLLCASVKIRLKKNEIKIQHTYYGKYLLVFVWRLFTAWGLLFMKIIITNGYTVGYFVGLFEFVKMSISQFAFLFSLDLTRKWLNRLRKRENRLLHSNKSRLVWLTSDM